MVFHPTTELVAVAWLRGIALPAVGTTLPATLPAEGFIQVTGVGGSPDIDIPVARPVVAVDCWVASVNSNKPQWGRANQLAEIIRAATHHPSAGRTVSVMDGYNDARVMSVYMLTEPRKVPNDDASYARFTFDLHFHFVEVVAA